MLYQISLILRKRVICGNQCKLYLTEPYRIQLWILYFISFNSRFTSFVVIFRLIFSFFTLILYVLMNVVCSSNESWFQSRLCVRIVIRALFSSMSACLIRGQNFRSLVLAESRLRHCFLYRLFVT